VRGTHIPSAAALGYDWDTRFAGFKKYRIDYDYDYDFDNNGHKYDYISHCIILVKIVSFGLKKKKRIVILY